MTVSVIGAGAFGTALAITLCGRAPVTLWVRSEEAAEEMRALRQNARRLPDVTIPDEVNVTTDFAHACQAETILLAVPMQQLRGVLNSHKSNLSGRSLVACCKGVEMDSHMGPVHILRQEVPKARHALLTGPSFALDIARGLPTALTLACADDDVGHELQHSLTTQSLRIYTTTDVIGAELGGALKNVMAIACGAVLGAGLGDSARAALMTRGFAEMQRLAIAQGAKAQTLAGLSGFGDLVLTCSSTQSRNYQMGLAIGAGSDALPKATVEGVATARSVAAYAVEAGLDLPIIQTVAALVDGKTSLNDAVATLLARPLKRE